MPSLIPKDRAYIEDRSIPEPMSGCWLWLLSVLPSGHGQLTVRRNGKLFALRAHRLSWDIFNGPIPAGLQVLHKCDQPSCVNPDHLFLGTHLDNMADMARKGRAAWSKTHHLVGEQLKHKLTESQALEVLETTGTIRGADMARKFKVSRSCISSIRRGKSWNHLK